MTRPGDGPLCACGNWGEHVPNVDCGEPILPADPPAALDAWMPVWRALQAACADCRSPGESRTVNGYSCPRHRPLYLAAIDALRRTERLRDDEWLGDTLHTIMHPGHPWSGCTHPDPWYKRAAVLRAALSDTAEDAG